MTQFVRSNKQSPKRQKSPTSSQGRQSQTTPMTFNPDLLTPDKVLQLQRQFGNKFVTNLVQGQQTTNTSNTAKIQRDFFSKMFKGKDNKNEDEDIGLVGNDSMQSDDSTFETFEPEEKSTNPFEWDETPEDGVEDPNFFDGLEDDNTKQKGQNPNLEVDNQGFTGKFGKIKAQGQVGYTGYKTGDQISELTSDKSLGTNIGKGSKYVGKKTGKGIKKLFTGKSKNNKKSGGGDDEKQAAGWWSKIKNAIKTIINGIKNGMKAGVNFFSPVMSAIGQVKDVLDDIAKYGVPFVSTIISAITGAYSVYSSWSTYQAYDIAGKEAKQLLEANEDEDTDETTSLLKDKSSSKSARYAAAKSFRAFWSKLVSFGLTLGKGVAEIATLFTGGASEIIAIGISLTQAAKKGVGYAKALYKIIKGTKGKNRALHANKIMESADEGNEDSLKLLLNLGLTGDQWMVKLATKLQVPYDPTYKEHTEVLYSRFLGKVKDEVVSFGSKQTNKRAKQVRSVNEKVDKKLPNKLTKIIEKQFIETDKETALALMIEPRTGDELHMYLQNLKEVGMYEDFAKEVMSSMKSN